VREKRILTEEARICASLNNEVNKSQMRIYQPGFWPGFFLIWNQLQLNFPNDVCRKI